MFQCGHRISNDFASSIKLTTLDCTKLSHDSHETIKEVAVKRLFLGEKFNLIYLEGIFIALVNFNLYVSKVPLS